MKKTTNKKAFDAALSMLGYRSYSETEIRTKLKRKGYEEEKIAEAIDSFSQVSVRLPSWDNAQAVKWSSPLVRIAIPQESERYNFLHWLFPPSGKSRNIW